MILFRHPWLLLLALLLPLLLWLRYAPSRAPRLRFPALSALRGLPRSPRLLLRFLPPVLFSLGFLALVVAVARPQRGLSESRAETEGIDIVLLVDTSTSMRAEDFSTSTKRLNRLDAAKQVLSRFIADRPDDRIGIVAFAALPFSIAPLTTDHDWLLLQLDRLKTGMLDDGTAIGDAIASAVNRLRESPAKSKIVVLLTDGINNAGQLPPIDAARAAAALGVKVYCVGAASDRPRSPGLFGFALSGPEIDEPALRSIAEATGGRYFRATDLSSLSETYAEIDRLEKTRVELDQYTSFQELFLPFALFALAALLAEALLSLTPIGELP